VLKRPDCIINYPKMRSDIRCSLTGLVILLENIKGGNLLYGVLHDELQKLLKDKLNKASLKRRKPSS